MWCISTSRLARGNLQQALFEERLSFLYLVAVVMGAVRAAASLGPVAALLVVYAWIAPYLFLALRVVYQESAAATFIKALVLLAAAFVVDNLVNFGAAYTAFQSA